MSGNFQVCAANHEVLMNHRIVDTHLMQFIFALVVAVFDNINKASAQSKVAASVFIEQGVVEQQTGLVDRAVKRNQRTFAQIACTLVHRKHFVQKVIVLFCVSFYCFSVFKANPEILNQLTLIAQWFCGINDSLGNAFFRGGKTFLGRNVRVKYSAGVGGFRTSAEACAVD